MKAKRLLLLVMAICLASGVNAQFYDGPDDIYYYVAAEDFWNETNSAEVNKTGYWAYVFNFDGRKATHFGGQYSRDGIISYLQQNPNYFEEKVETADYSRIKYVSSSGSETIYEYPWVGSTKIWLYFSADRKVLISRVMNSTGPKDKGDGNKYIRVDKSFFRVGRSRTPSGTMYE